MELAVAAVSQCYCCWLSTAVVGDDKLLTSGGYESYDTAVANSSADFLSLSESAEAGNGMEGWDRIRVGRSAVAASLK
jgi:hypothetical protein